MFVEIFILVTYHMYSMLKALHFLFIVCINILSNYFSTVFFSLILLVPINSTNTNDNEAEYIVFDMCNLINISPFVVIKSI